MSHTTSTPSFVGIDVSSGTLDVCSIPEKQLWTVGNDPAGRAALAKELQSRGVALIVLVATGGMRCQLSPSWPTPLCPWWWLIRGRSVILPRPWALLLRLIAWMPVSWLDLHKTSALKFVLC